MMMSRGSAELLSSWDIPLVVANGHTIIYLTYCCFYSLVTTACERLEHEFNLNRRFHSILRIEIERM
jgi:hypothetical protein